MTPDDYLRKIIKAQTLADDSEEIKALRKRREQVEKLLRKAFGSSPTIRYGGSQAKGTLVKDSYDLDLVCYFPSDEEEAGETIEALYNAVRVELQKEYFVEPKTSALRIKGLDLADFHVDVVPGRFIDEKTADVFLFQTTAEKCRLKTNIETHIAHVKESGLIDAIKLAKIWRTRNNVALKTFVLELIVIEVLHGSTAALDKQLRKLMEALRDGAEKIKVEDPANPTGNNLAGAWNDSVQQTAALIAKSTLAIVDASGWEGVFGKLPVASDVSTIEVLRRAAQATSNPSKPWRR
jgi:hypothetical protein